MEGDTETEEYFAALTGSVSYGMGTPTNIGIWIIVVVVVVWIGLFALHILGANTTLLPAWFASNAFDFPLNTVTTLAELYISFHCDASTNRSEKRNREVSQRTANMLEAYST